MSALPLRQASQRGVTPKSFAGSTAAPERISAVAIDVASK